MNGFRGTGYCATGRWFGRGTDTRRVVRGDDSSRRKKEFDVGFRLFANLTFIPGVIYHKSCDYFHFFSTQSVLRYYPCNDVMTAMGSG